MTTINWTHTDSRGISQGVASAYARTDWSSSNGPGTPIAAKPATTVVADLRALLVATAFARATLGGSYSVVQQGGNPVLVVGPFGWAQDKFRAGIQAQLDQTIRLLAGRGALSSDAPSANFSTSDGDSPGSGEAGFVVSGALVAVLAIAAAGAYAYIAYRALKVADNELARFEETRRMVIRHAQAVKMLDDHHTREKSAGKLLPFDAGETQVLSALGDAQRIAAAKKDPAAESGNSRGGFGDVLPWLAVAAIALVALNH